jgi:hypothetical protein
MDETYLKTTLANMGHFEVTGVKVVRDGSTKEPAGYGFLQFRDESVAQAFFRRVEGKVIPDALKVTSCPSKLSIIDAAITRFLASLSEARHVFYEFIFSS